ncbi:DUF3545 family protein [Pseudidiomarina sp. CB1]|jgi:hypothetical protein|uniref:DUF3545 family protein n=1 Tax=Pseudidiomarina sp. CB1 TaxID=2972484 RepID=UPI0021616ED8|nr:DUF3545 family protein [Pseudidiomarina sp. CB1]|tara:strand:- start:63 stop:233 length:171 start_codon:yes stop_codon:yes gene_type:complete
MDHSEELNGVEAKQNKSRRVKRKWREIEALKEKYRLRDELKDMDYGLDLELDELEF